MPTIKVVQENSRMKRKTRSPRIDFAGRTRPFCLTPICIHPVLPGETLKKAYWNVTAVSDPLASKMHGAHIDIWFFYVKATQLSNSTEMVNMFVDEGALTPTVGADREFFQAAGGVPFTRMAYERVVEWYFRDADESLTPASGLIGNFQPIRVERKGWWNNLKLESTAPTADELLPGEALEMPESVPAGFSDHWTQFNRMRALGFTAASFEDYLRAQGVQVPKDASRDEELLKPELLRHVQDWQFPNNTVEPTTGVPTTAHFFRLTDSADKDRYFEEPGFILGVLAYRPKVMFGNLDGSMSHHMNKFTDWMPAILRDQPFTRLKEFATATGPAPEAFGQDVWADMTDYLLDGEQLWNSTAVGNQVALPTTTTNSKYPTQADAMSLFTDTANGRLWLEAVITLNIASPIFRDHTPD